MSDLEPYRRAYPGKTDEELEAIRSRFRAFARVLIDWYVDERGQKLEPSR